MAALNKMTSAYNMSNSLPVKFQYNNWQGFSTLIAGTSDNNRIFHPFRLAVTRSETAEDFEFVFRTLHEARLEWQPTLLLADGSKAITLGITRVFGPT